MKIMINTTETEIRTMLETTAETIRVFEPTAIDACTVDDTINHITSTDSVYHFAQNCSSTLDHCNFTIDIDEQMIKDLAPMIIKVAKLVAPIYHSAKALLMTITSLCKTLPMSIKSLSKDFRDKWFLRKKYQVVKLENKDLDLLDVAILEDDGKNDPEIIEIFHVGEVYEKMMVQRHMVAKMTLGESTIETREEAQKIARAIRDGLSEDTTTCSTDTETVDWDI